MKILVTGGAGFIGSNLVDELIKKGNQVVVIDNLFSGKEENVNKKAKFYKIDICKEGLSNVFEKEKPDVVNHHAAQIDLRRSVEEPILDAKINILGSINVFNNCVKHKVRKVIFASTGGAIYGDTETKPTPEGYPAWPVSPYGVAKLTAEHYLYFYHKIYNLSYVALRYGNVYGPRQDPHGEAGVVAIFAKKMLEGKEAIINGSGKQTRDFVYVKDVIDANIKCLRTDFSGAINIGTGKETDINKIFRVINKLTGNKIEEVYGPAKPGEQKSSCLDIRRAKKVLGWKPKVDLESGLEKTVAYFKKL